MKLLARVIDDVSVELSSLLERAPPMILSRRCIERFVQWGGIHRDISPTVTLVYTSPAPSPGSECGEEEEGPISPATVNLTLGMSHVVIHGVSPHGRLSADNVAKESVLAFFATLTHDWSPGKAFVLK